MNEKSYMLVISTKEALLDLDGIFQRLGETNKFKVESMDMDEEGVLQLEVDYNEEIFQVEVYPRYFEIPEFFRSHHLFSDLDFEKIDEMEEGLSVEMYFGKDALNSYHFQLQLIDAMLPNKFAIIDYSSEKILSGKWATLAAQSEIPPAPRYLYSVQAVSGEDEIVWLHTHGLNRCGLTELEILSSTKDTYYNHYNIIETMANRMMGLEEPLEPRAAFYLGQLEEEVHLVTTFVPWEEAVEFYDEEMLGGKMDRKESHNEQTSVLFTYLSEEDYENARYTPVSFYDDFLKENPVYWVSTKETNRMKALAFERIDYLKQATQNDDYVIMVKIGLKVDDEFITEDNHLEQEHIWFELLDFSDETLNARLTQEPYFIQGFHVGDIGQYDLTDITDWYIATPERKITPDDVYLLEMDTVQ